MGKRASKIDKNVSPKDVIENGDKVLVQIEDHQSIVSIDEEELAQKQADGENIMILALMK